jgi:hypothetical protein
LFFTRGCSCCIHQFSLDLACTAGAGHVGQIACAAACQRKYSQCVH